MPNSPPTPQDSTATTHTESFHLPLTCDPPLPSVPLEPKVWVIFGATGLMGRALVNAALEHGDKVAAVGRMHETSREAMQGWHENCLGDLCDVRVWSTVDQVFKRTLSHFGQIDVIANCTLYGVIGSCEDQSIADVRAQFETNYFGTLNIIQLSLPYFRLRDRSTAVKAHSRKRSDAAGSDGESSSTSSGGRYLIFSSTSGALGVPGLGPFGATKYAIEALVESMLYETDAYGIKATLVSPGPLRNDLPDRDKSTSKGDSSTQQHSNNRSVQSSSDTPSVAKANNSSSSTKFAQTQTQLPSTTAYGSFIIRRPSPAYATRTAPAQHAQRMAQWLGDRQPVSAVRSAELAWQLGHCRFPPLRLLLGTYAVESIRDRSKSITEEIEDWKHLNIGNLGSGANGASAAVRHQKGTGKHDAGMDSSDHEHENENENEHENDNDHENENENEHDSEHEDGHEHGHSDGIERDEDDSMHGSDAIP